MNRRTFITTTALATAATASSGHSPEKPMLTHHVFFWLKNSQSVADRDKLIAGLKTLRSIDGIKALHIGVPAATEKRDVVDNSYAVSELMFFDDLEAQARYQEHPIHKAFIEKCSSLWTKVVVYDAMDVS
ncbi:MAG TPA: Dabb family protein [Cyclobacteriaceae bacterium]|nr:Dabb family protein [Cyclobacteriaceae bacterium]